MRLLLLTLCIILFGGNTLRLEAKKHFFSNYNFCHITEEAGLPNNSVTAVIKIHSDISGWPLRTGWRVTTAIVS